VVLFAGGQQHVAEDRGGRRARDARQTIVAGACEAVHRMIAAGDTDKLPSMLPDLVESALLPYVGEAQATAHRRAQQDDVSRVGPVPETVH
jgi:hypothetical protein